MFAAYLHLKPFWGSKELTTPTTSTNRNEELPQNKESSRVEALLEREESASGGEELPIDEVLLEEMEWENSFTGHTATAEGCIHERRYRDLNVGI